MLAEALIDSIVPVCFLYRLLAMQQVRLLIDIIYMYTNRGQEIDRQAFWHAIRQSGNQSGNQPINQSTGLCGLNLE